MKLSIKSKTLGFKVIIWLDRGLNVITGGSFQECLSTRAHLKASNGSKCWVKIRNAIDWMFWNGHCKCSFLWECRIKRDWLIEHGDY